MMMTDVGDETHGSMLLQELLLGMRIGQGCSDGRVPDWPGCEPKEMHDWALAVSWTSRALACIAETRGYVVCTRRAHVPLQNKLMTHINRYPVWAQLVRRLSCVK